MPMYKLEKGDLNEVPIFRVYFVCHSLRLIWMLL
jgi:hypothetical protein